MQIRELNIDGFGIFSNKQVTGLTKGLNVIYGENETGKTTLVEFIRRILFEAPKRTKEPNPYLPLNGARHGGGLKCQLASGETILVSRSLENKGEALLSTRTSELKGQPALDAVLGHASLLLFQNIFAFTLDELQTFDSLNENEIKNRIYGAEIGLGTVSLKAVEDSIDNRAKAIFVSRGKKTETNILLNEIQEIEKKIRSIQQESGEYDLLMRQLESCEKEQSALAGQIQSLQLRIRNLNAWNELNQTLDEEETCLHNLKIDQDSLDVNRALLTHQADILYLQQSTQSVRSALMDKSARQKEKVLLEEKIRSDLREIGGHWDEEKVQKFVLDQAGKNQIESFARAFENLRLEISKAEDRLELHRQQKAAERSKGWNIPAWWKTIAYSLTGLGLAGLILSLLKSNTPLLVATALSLLCGLFIFWQTLRGGKDFTREDLLEKSLAEKLHQAQADYDQKKSQWRAWLREMSFDESLEPLNAQEFAHTLRQIKESIVGKAELEARIGGMLKLEEEITNRIVKIKSALPENSLQDHIPTNIKIIGELFASAKENQTRRNQIEKQIQQQLFKIGKLKTSLNELQPSLEPAEQNPAIENDNNNPSAHLALAVKEALNSAANRLKELEDEKNRLHETTGETRNKLKQLTANEALLTEQETLEIKKQNLRGKVREWCRAKLALFMLDKARKQYEKTRQPEVLKAAEEIFSGITGGKYPRIVKLMDDDEICIENQTGERINIHQMSRGTREQLYLSLRLGLIEAYETRSEPLPIIMDDVLVNFDDNRKLNVIDMLKRFAQNRQIIVLTCHRASLEAYKNAGANEIRI